MSNAKTQCSRIIDYVKKYGSITVSEAQRDLGINSLTRRICDIERQGHTVTKTWENGSNRFGEPTRYMRYSIDEIHN